MAITTIVRGTARRLGITRPLPRRELTRKQRIEREAQGLSQALLGIVGVGLRQPPVITERPTPMVVDRDFVERRCETCGFVADFHRWAVVPDKAHRCRRDDVVVIVVWPGGR